MRGSESGVSSQPRTCFAFYAVRWYGLDLAKTRPRKTASRVGSGLTQQALGRVPILRTIAGFAFSELALSSSPSEAVGGMDL